MFDFIKNFSYELTAMSISMLPVLMSVLITSQQLFKKYNEITKSKHNIDADIKKVSQDCTVNMHNEKNDNESVIENVAYHVTMLSDEKCDEIDNTITSYLLHKNDTIQELREKRNTDKFEQVHKKWTIEKRDLLW